MGAIAVHTVFRKSKKERKIFPIFFRGHIKNDRYGSIAVCGSLIEMLGKVAKKVSFSIVLTRDGHADADSCGLMPYADAMRKTKYV